MHVNERGKPHDSTGHMDISLGTSLGTCVMYAPQILLFVKYTMSLLSVYMCIYTPTALPGVEVCAETTIVVTNNQQSFYWEGYGLKLNIPKGSLPTGVEQCTIKIVASRAGQYKFPEETHLVSGVFWLQCDHAVKFAELISLEIQHCARTEDLSKLNFVRAVCTQKDLPYTFRRLNPVFSSNSSYGLIRLQRFSGLAITHEGSPDREYIARLFYLNPNVFTYDIHLVVTWNIESHLTVSRVT